MKKLLFLIIVIILFVVSIKIGNKLMVSYLEIKPSEETSATPSLFTKKEKTYIKESGEIQATDLYYVAGGNKVEDTNLENDMSFDNVSNFFYKIITKPDTYIKYKDFFDMPEVSENDFQNYFVIIIYNKDERALDETDLYISKIYIEENITHIVMKQKDNASAFALNNVYYAIAENSQLTDAISIDIDK